VSETDDGFVVGLERNLYRRPPARRSGLIVPAPRAGTTMQLALEPFVLVYYWRSRPRWQSIKSAAVSSVHTRPPPKSIDHGAL
jgi:hypothetical protein